MIDLTKTVMAEYLEPDDEVDFADDELCYNDKADEAYAVVHNTTFGYDKNGDPYVTIVTDQGSFSVPADHLVKVKVIE